MRRGVKRQKGATGAIRIISGQWRGRKLPVLDAEGLRPTTDRTKETLFNWLMPYIRDLDCLDCFAGSGSLGLEALSRHAASVLFVEQNSQASDQLQQNLNTLGVPSDKASVLNLDALQLKVGNERQFDLIFLDPPFNRGLLPPVLYMIEQNKLLRAGGLVYVECETAHADYAVPADWQMLKQKHTQQVDYRLYQSN